MTTTLMQCKPTHLKLWSHKKSSTEMSNKRTSVLSKSYRDEIVQAFRIFDTHRTATITPNSLKLLLRALGFRVTQQEVYREIILGKRRLGRANILDENDTEQIGEGVDLELVLNIMEERYNNKNYDPNDEMKINFRIFDKENKGYIQLSDLKRVVQELNQDSKHFGMDGLAQVDGSEMGGIFDELNLTDDQLTAMIHGFDSDQDSVINFSEFKKIMKFV